MHWRLQLLLLNRTRNHSQDAYLRSVTGILLTTPTVKQYFENRLTFAAVIPKTRAKAQGQERICVLGK